MPLLSVKDLTIYFNTDEGQITAEFDNSSSQADRGAIGLAMAGANRTAAA